jgi:hypothetical protein
VARTPALCARTGVVRPQVTRAAVAAAAAAAAAASRIPRSSLLLPPQQTFRFVLDFDFIVRGQRRRSRCSARRNNASWSPPLPSKVPFLPCSRHARPKKAWRRTDTSPAPPFLSRFGVVGAGRAAGGYAKARTIVIIITESLLRSCRGTRSTMNRLPPPSWSEYRRRPVAGPPRPYLPFLMIGRSHMRRSFVRSFHGLKMDVTTEAFAHSTHTSHTYDLPGNSDRAG